MTSALTKRLICLLVGCLCFALGRAQGKANDSLAYYDDLFNELDNFIDSLTAPRTMVLVNLSVSNNYLNYLSQEEFSLKPQRKINLAPSLGYYHKSGLGINASGSIIRDNNKINPYQFILTGSYDYLHSDAFISGVSMTRFFTKDSLSFYTSPLQNELNFYFTYKRWWVKPSVTASYGWGSRLAYEDRADYITWLRLRPYGYTRINTQESISDFSVSASVRRDFYWLDLLGNNYVLKVSPQIVFVSGTQKFGFNQTSDSYISNKNRRHNVLYNSENVYLDDSVYFQPLSLTAFLKSEVSLGKFYVQPQVALDYYFPAKEKNLSTGFVLNTGLIF